MSQKFLFFFAETDDLHCGSGREGAIFILLYHFRCSLKDVKTFICSFGFEMTTFYN